MAVFLFNKNNILIKTKKVLLVYPEAFDLGWRGATSRLIDISTMFANAGWVVQMLSAREWYLSKDQRPQEKEFKGHVIRTPFTGGYPRIFDRNRYLRRIFRIYWRIRGNEYYRNQLSLDWSKQTAKWVPKCWPYLEPTIIWSVCTSNINGMIAGQALSRYFHCPYIIEFQDPPSGFSNTTTKLVKQCIRNSNGIITTTASYADNIKKEFNLKEEKVITLYLASHEQNVDDNESMLPMVNRKLVFLHAGTLFADPKQRCAHDFLHGMKQAIELRPDIRVKIQFRLVGAGPGKVASMQLAKSLCINEYLQCINEVPLDRLAMEINQSDVLIVIKYPHSAYDMQIPGKIFQYLGFHKPILGIMRSNCEAASILKQSGLGHIVAPGNIDAIASYIIDTVDNCAHLSEKYPPNNEFIKQFDLDSMGAKGMKFICNIINQGFESIAGEESRKSLGGGYAS